MNNASVKRIMALTATLVMSGCSSPAPPTAAQPITEFRPVATVQDLMEQLVDPSADALWDSVAYIAKPGGIEDRRPRTDQEWRAVRASAITLIEAVNLLSMQGRRVAADDRRPGPGELSTADIERRLSTTHAGFVGFAQNLQTAGLKALAAIDAKNAEGLMDAGGNIDEACEACHLTYWYPNQKRPGG